MATQTPKPTSNRIGFFQPASFDPSPFGFRHADGARYTLGLILRKSATSDDGYARLHAQHLRDILGSRYATQILKPLIGSGVIGRKPFDRRRKQSFGYHVSTDFADDAIRWTGATNPTIRDNLRAHYRRKAEVEKTTWQPIHYTLREMQRHLRIDYDAAMAEVESLEPEVRLGQRLLVEQIHQRRMRFSVCAQGRVHNSITSKKRCLRRHLRSNEEHLTGTDIVNSQPALLATTLRGTQGTGPGSLPYTLRTLLARKGGEREWSKSTQRYIELAESGRWYEELVDGTGLSRDECKAQFLVDVLAKKGRYQRRAAEGTRSVESYVCDAYPELLSVIRTVNSDDHGNLIRLLQRVESHVVIHTVAASLADEHPSVPVFTLHDAIFIQRSRSKLVEDAFADACERLGISLKTETKPA